MKQQAFKRILLLILIPVFTLLIGSSLLSSCYYDNEEYLYPTNGLACDTLSPTYKLDIAPIMVNNSCNNQNCHNSGSHPDTDVVTDNYQDLTTNISRVWNSINHIGDFPMPKNGGTLSVCEIAKIKRWRDLGMPNP